MMRAERMSPVDRAWLSMERPTNPMMIVGVVICSGQLSREQLRARVAERFVTFERFRCIPVQEPLSARWEPCPQFDLDDHILEAALPHRAGQRELEALVGELASTALNPARPWWSFHLVERYGSGCALIVRIHHCYADGIALIRVLLRLADDSSTARLRASHSRPGEDLQPAPPSSALGSLYTPIADLVAKTLREGANLIEHGLHYTLHPNEAMDAAQGAMGAIGELARLGTLPDDPATCLKQTLSGARHVAWGTPLAFDEVRTLSHLLGCTINDVLIATLTGALGRYLEAHSGLTQGMTLHAAVPVNLRKEDDSEPALGNRFGLVFVPLPVDIRHPLERLYAVHAAMQSLKGSAQALMTFGLLATVGSLPVAVEDPAMALFSAKASLVASNVPGPRQPLYLAGVRIEQMLFWVPQAGSIGTGISMLTYTGSVQFGVISDRQLIADPHELVQLIGAEFEQLVYLVLLGAVAVQPRAAGS
jgi:WS/DGAT/MGAT family acyltransferase